MIVQYISQKSIIRCLYCEIVRSILKNLVCVFNTDSIILYVINMTQNLKTTLKKM